MISWRNHLRSGILGVHVYTHIKHRPFGEYMYMINRNDSAFNLSKTNTVNGEEARSRESWKLKGCLGTSY
jgi:hypothetical protein